MVGCSDASRELQVVADGCLCQESIPDTFSIVDGEGESVAHAALIEVDARLVVGGVEIAYESVNLMAVGDVELCALANHESVTLAAESGICLGVESECGYGV